MRRVLHSANRAMRLTMERSHLARQPKRKPEKSRIGFLSATPSSSKIVAYAQGFDKMSVASAQFKWDLKLGDAELIPARGCVYPRNRSHQGSRRDRKLAVSCCRTIIS